MQVGKRPQRFDALTSNEFADTVADRMSSPERVTSSPMRFLRSRRNMPMLPHRFVAPLAAMVREMSEVAQGIAREFDDPAWKKSAEVLAHVAELLRDASR
jgi:hypothetical protein